MLNIVGIREATDAQIIQRLEEILEAAKNGKLKKIVYYAVTESAWIYEFKTGMDAFELLALLERLKFNVLKWWDSA